MKQLIDGTWMNMAIEIVDFPIEIVDFPIENMVIFYSYVKLPEGICSIISKDPSDSARHEADSG